MRIVHTDEITKAVKEMCIQANYQLSQDVSQAVHTAAEQEFNELGKHILTKLCENMQIAKEDQIPICQDTGMAVVFLKVGQDVHIEGANITVSS